LRWVGQHIFVRWHGNGMSPLGLAGAAAACVVFLLLGELWNRRGTGAPPGCSTKDVPDTLAWMTVDHDL
jgi:hypothetical protein